MDAPLISVIVPVYNVERYLDRCVESIVKQSYDSLEIILVDDGSPDQCPQLCDGWVKKDARIKVIHKLNAGLGMARNSGLACATGAFVCFVDSDDYIAPNAVARCLQQVKEQKADTVLYGRYDAYPDGTEKEDERNVAEHFYSGNQVIHKLLPELLASGVGYGVSACSKMFSLEIIRKYGICFRSEREVISEDAIFCLDYFAKARNVSVIPDRLYYYFQNGSSLSRTYRPDRQLKNNAFLQKSIERVRELALPEALEAYLKSRYHVFSLAAMKHIVTADLTAADKRMELRKIYKDPVLCNTITYRVFRLDSWAIAVFMILLRLKLYFLCNILLKVKT